MSLSRQEDFLTKGRLNQKHRTRDALLDAAVELARHGHSPSIAEVAEAARVSVATAYRYYPNPLSLWADMVTRTGAADFADFFEQLPNDPEAAIEAVVRKVAAMQFADEPLWRGGLRASLDRWFTQLELPENERVPIRGITRLQMARRALAPLRDRLPDKDFDRLVNAVVLVFGLEALIATRDTCGLEPEAATEVMGWAAKALVRTALTDANP